MKRSFTTTLVLCFCCFLGIVFGSDSSSPIPLDEPPTLAKSELLSGHHEDSSVRTYIVQFVDDPVIVKHRNRRTRKLQPTSTRVLEYVSYLERKQDEMVATIGGSKVLSYKYAFNGMAIRMSASEAQRMAQEESVLRVTPNQIRNMETDTSSSFLELAGQGKPWSLGYTGEDIVVGIIDGGINPDHLSFQDTPTPANGNEGPNIPYGPPPNGFSGTACHFGNQNYNSNDAPASCNNKLLTARCYATAWSDQTNRLMLCGGDGARLSNKEFLSARDSRNHGSHTAGTAAGNYGVEAVVEGKVVGTVTGMAPRARIAVYKVCWNERGGDGGRCGLSDIMAAIDQAVADGVDVINYSLGSNSLRSFTEADDIAFLFAADAGLFVATSQGNNGPDPRSVGTPAGVPWITAVGAVGDDNTFSYELQVTSPASVARNYESREGRSPVKIEDVDFSGGDLEMVLAEPQDACTPLENEEDLTGKIALVIRGSCRFAEKYNIVAEAGGKFIVVYNDGTDSDRIAPIRMVAANTTIPGLMISFTDGEPLAQIQEEAITANLPLVSQANRIASFSSRGPNKLGSAVLKPDMVAPGVDILAAAGFDEEGKENFALLDGTSMSSPHVAGAFALLKQAHRDWTPAMARSALMTTARQDITQGVMDEETTPFDIGAGHIVPSKAFDPGLVYDAGYDDYIAFLCGFDKALSNESFCTEHATVEPFDPTSLNYPAIVVERLLASKTVVRSVTRASSDSSPETYSVSVDPPPGIGVEVVPSTVTLAGGESATVRVTLRAMAGVEVDKWLFGSMTWSNTGSTHLNSRKHSVRSPIAVFTELFEAPSLLSSSDLVGSTTFNVKFSYSGDYQAEVYGLAAPVTQEATVSDDPRNNYSFRFQRGVRRFRFEFNEGTVFARFSLFDEFTDGNDDLDLFVWECLQPQSLGEEEKCSFVRLGGGISSNETVDVEFPKAFGGPNSTYYLVDVHGFKTDGPDANFTLFHWALDRNFGNIQIDAPDTAVAGTTEPVTIEWALQESAVKYLGAVVHTGPDGPLELTFIDVDTT